MPASTSLWFEGGRSPGSGARNAHAVRPRCQASPGGCYNSLVCHRFAREFGRPSVLQLTPGQGGDQRDPDHRLVGRTPWGEGGTYWMLASEFWSRRQQFKVTAISEEFGWDDLRAHNPGGRFLFWVTSSRIEPIDAAAKPPDGAAVVWLEGEVPAGDAGAERGDSAAGGADPATDATAAADPAKRPE